MRNCIINLLRNADLISARELAAQSSTITLQPLSGDGSVRRFLRVYCTDRPLCFAVLPALPEPRDLAEARSSLAIARHLGQADVPVPEVLAADEERGVIIFEDLGNQRLHDALREDRQRGLAWYPQVMTLLAHLQVVGARGFQKDWCYDSPVYDSSVMVQREAGYFYQAFWRDTLFAEQVDGLYEEFEHLADEAAQDFEWFFLHRDFQSRNIMVKDGALRVIDFQAGRLGPPGYDIASLLIDPYAALSDEMQEVLFAGYLAELAQYEEVDCGKVSRSFQLLAVLRNLQIIGAFAYLSGRKRKNFFLHYIIPSLVMLQNRLSDRRFEEYPLLRRTVSEGLLKYRALPRGL